MFRVIICGSRWFNDMSFIYKKLDALLINQKDVEIIDGGCPGVDQVAEMYAHDRELKNTIFHAKWQKYGKGAGPKRNEEMAVSSPTPDGCVAFWDGESRGTLNMIAIAKAKNIPVKIIKISKQNKIK
jgi:hypothetical protein